MGGVRAQDRVARKGGGHLQIEPTSRSWASWRRKGFNICKGGGSGTTRLARLDVAPKQRVHKARGFLEPFLVVI